ncbi:Fanconi anemia group A protein isoform X2 [Thamnophis elegans]|uniref:Fanconi anemia group A protein isoform X2 n=1 Tax=Thamnophis elegans TaxID=35005 RepID=UPI001378A304|nr:Fanconi anemia group A protein isoform X2 [Thamnophis elegans]
MGWLRFPPFESRSVPSPCSSGCPALLPIGPSTPHPSVSPASADQEMGAAGRCKKPKEEPKTQQELREAALRIWSRHQRLDQLLLENGSSEDGKSILSSNLGRGGSKMSVPEQFVVTALKDEASVLGMPAGILSARMAANLIEKISMESDETTLLSAEHRKKLFCLFQSLKELLAYNAFCHSAFAEEMWKTQRPPILEVAWHLHRENIVRLEELLEKNLEVPTLVDWLSSSLRLLCHQMEETDTEIGQNILTDLALVLLQNGFPKTPEAPEMKRVSEICCAVLERMLAWVLDAVATEKQGRASPTGKAVRCWLQVYSLVVSRGTAPPEHLQALFGHIFTRVLTYNPHLTVSDAIHLQREWSFARTSSLLATLYRKVFVVFQPEELTGRLQQVLETSEVNWHHVLSCVSTFLVCHSQAEQLLKDLLGGLLRKAFANYDLESLITTFLIVRQAALEGPALFPPYAEWFKLTFGNGSSLHGGSRKALIFFFKFLSQLVPFEAPQYLKVHLLHPPFVPSKYRALLLEYTTLAKTRLADLKVSIEDMGLYENLSSTEEASQPSCQALQDVEKAIQIFRNTGKIPASVLEASIFRRSYYVSRFLPALLVPRVLPESPNTRLALIEALKRAGKIPPNAYATYLEECEAAERKLLPEGSAEREVGGPKEPLERLKAELEALRLLVTDANKHSAVPAQMAVVSGRLMEALGDVTDGDEAASLTLRVRLDLWAPEVGAADRRAVDLLLASFCQGVTAASFFLPPDRQGPWASLFVKMVSGHRRLLSPLLSRLCQLLYHQGPSLSDAHVLGLAAFVVHFNEAESLLPPVDLGFPSVPRVALHTDLPLAGLWDRLLAPRGGDSALFCLRFCTAAVSYFLCKFPSLPHQHLCSVLHPGFVKKLQYVVPRLCLEARETGCGGDSAASPWKALSRPPLCHQKAALGLWKQTRFQELLREEAFQLTLPEWLKMELQVLPDQDLLSANERQEFHSWSLHQHFLPRPVAAGGCGGDLREMGALFAKAILDSLQSRDSEPCSLQRKPTCSLGPERGNPDLYCRFQELVLELELERRRGRPEEHFLLQVFQERLRALGTTGAALGDRLLRQRELLSQTRILLSLPPSVLVATQKRGGEIVVACGGFFSFVNAELRNGCSRGCSLPFDITAHFFRGLLSASVECSRPAQEVTAVLSSCQARCPILLSSAARWWPRLEPVLCSQWKRLFDGPLAQGLQSLKDLRSSVQRAWVSAAFLHFSVQQQADPEEQGAVLGRLGPEAEQGQFLTYVLFFSVMDLISAKVAPQEGTEAQKVLDWSSRVLRRLVEEGPAWLAVFCPAGKGSELYETLRDAVSDQHLKMLPVAFYSLLLAFDGEELIREQTFLPVAVDMYTQLLQLFTEGAPVVALSQKEQSLHICNLGDSLLLIQQARQLLLRAIPRSPPGSFSNLQEVSARMDIQKARRPRSWPCFCSAFPSVEGSTSYSNLDHTCLQSSPNKISLGLHGFQIQPSLELCSPAETTSTAGLRRLQQTGRTDVGPGGSSRLSHPGIPPESPFFACPADLPPLHPFLGRQSLSAKAVWGTRGIGCCRWSLGLL